MIKKISLGIAFFIVIGAAYLLDTVWSAGAFKTIDPQFSGQCTAVRGVIGVEDITIDQSNGLAYLSSHDRRAWRAKGAEAGDIFLYRTGSFTTPIRMSHDFKGDFHPHGISLWVNAAGNDRLFVVNHPGAPSESKSQVEIFDIIDGRLLHIKTAIPEEGYSLNDVAATGPDSFFATIDRGSLTPFGRTLEAYGRLARGGLAYGFSGQMQKVKTGLVYPNGIQAVEDMLFVSETSGKRLIAFKNTGPNGALEEVYDIDIDSGLDNIEVGADGSLWIGAHPRMIDFPPHAKDGANRSPSQVLLLSPTGAGPTGGSFNPQTIYLTDGNPLSGSSVAAPYGDRFLIGSVFEPMILDCVF